MPTGFPGYRGMGSSPMPAPLETLTDNLGTVTTLSMLALLPVALHLAAPRGQNPPGIRAAMHPRFHEKANLSSQSRRGGSV